MERVAIYHPEIPHTEEAPVVVSREEYDAVWHDKGWRLHPPKGKKESK